MDTIEMIAKDIEHAQSDDKKKDMILWIVTAVLLFVPYLGEAIFAGLHFTVLANALAMAGVAVGLGLDVYTIVEDPGSAYMVVIHWLARGCRHRQLLEKGKERLRAEMMIDRVATTPKLTT